MARYMLILHDDPSSYAELSPGDMQRIIAQYEAWSARMAQAGHILGGEKLKDEGGKHLRRVDGRLHVTDGPYAEAKEVVGGYFLIRADSYEHALELCHDHPHLTWGAKIELRAIEEL